MDRIFRRLTRRLEGSRGGWSNAKSGGPAAARVFDMRYYIDLMAQYAKLYGKSALIAISFNM
jgi:hypothetical protein